MISTALAGLAGVLIAPLFNVHSDMGTLFGIKAFAVAILGGITSAWGVMLAGLAYGLIEAMVTAFFGSVYTQIVAFSFVILALDRLAQWLLRSCRGEQGMTTRLGQARRRRHADRDTGADGGRRSLCCAGRRLCAVHPGAGCADDGGRRRAQHSGRPDRADIARSCRLLRHRRLHRGDPDHARGIDFWIAFPARRRDRGCRRLPAGIAGVARDRTLSRDGHDRLCLHRPARRDRVARSDRRRQRADESQAARDCRQGFRGTRDGGAGRHARRRVALFFLPPRQQCMGQGHGGGARCRGCRALDRAQPGDHQDRRLRAVGGIHGLAGAIFAPLFMFVAPDSFPFSQSILFLLAVVLGGAGWVLGPVVGAVHQRGRPGIAVGAGGVPPAVFRQPVAGRAVARARGRAGHAGALVPPDAIRAPPTATIST